MTPTVTQKIIIVKILLRHYTSGEPALLDLKSRTLYKDQIIQVAAYKRLWDEDPAHKDIQIKSVHVLGMTEGFHHHHISARNLHMGIGAFDALLELQVFIKGIKVWWF